MTGPHPLTTILTILQQSEYDVPQVMQWVTTHPQSQPLTPDEWTPKLRMIALLCRWMPFLPLSTRLSCAIAVTAPVEWGVRTITYQRAKRKLAQLRAHGLIVVAIAGSFGKTSTKEILRHTLSNQQTIYATPKSINTRLGIAQCILRDLTTHHTLFVAELGEYHPQDIPQLTTFLSPDFGILTPIGRQHLKIIGGMQAIIKTFATFLDFFPQDRVICAQENQQFFPDRPLHTYGSTPDCTLHITDNVVDRNGTEFACVLPDQQHPLSVFTPLYGAHQAKNFLPSIWLAHALHADIPKVLQQFATQPYIHRRHEPTFAANNVLILDNSYNTNPDAITSSLQLVQDLHPARSFIITLGFVELDDHADEIHTQLGKTLANQIDYVGLIDAPWSPVIHSAFLAAGGKPTHIIIGKNQEELLTQFHDKIIANSIILIEGGYQELHR